MDNQTEDTIEKEFADRIIPEIFKTHGGKLCFMVMVDKKMTVHIAARSNCASDTETAVIAGIGEGLRLSVLDYFDEFSRIESAIYTLIGGIVAGPNNPGPEPLSIFDQWIGHKVEEFVSRIEQHPTFYGATITYWEGYGFLVGLRDAWLTAFMVGHAIMDTDKMATAYKTLRNALLARSDSPDSLLARMVRGEEDESCHD